MCVTEIRVKQIRVNQGLGVLKTNIWFVDQSSLDIGLSILSKFIRHLDAGLQYSANCFSRSASFALGHFCCFG